MIEHRTTFTTDTASRLLPELPPHDRKRPHPVSGFGGGMIPILDTHEQIALGMVRRERPAYRTL